MGDAIPKIIRSTFQLKRGNSADWSAQNPVLLEGEPGFELDTGKLKVGDGVSTWEELDSVSGASASYDPNSLIEENNGSVRLTIGDSYIDPVPQDIYNSSLISNLTDDQAVNYYKATAEIADLMEHTPIYLSYADKAEELLTSSHPSTISVENYSEVTFSNQTNISENLLAFKVIKDENTNIYNIQGASEASHELSNGAIWHIKNVNNQTIELIVDTDVPNTENFIYSQWSGGELTKDTAEAAIEAGETDPNYHSAIAVKQFVEMVLGSLSFSNLIDHDKIAERILPMIMGQTEIEDPDGNADFIDWDREKNDSTKPAGLFIVMPDPNAEPSTIANTMLIGIFDTEFPMSPETTLASLQSTSTTSNYLYTNISNDDISSWLGKTAFPKADNEEPSFIFEYNSTSSNVNIISDEDFSNNYITLYWNEEITKHKVLPDTSFETDNFIKIENGTIGLTLGDSVIDTETGETSTIKLPSSYIETIDTIDTSSNIPTAAAVKSAIDKIIVDSTTIGGVDITNNVADIVSGNANVPTAGAIADALTILDRVKTINSTLPDANGNIDINVDGAYYFGYQDYDAPGFISNNSSSTSVYINSPTQGYKTATKGAILYQRERNQAHSIYYYRYNSYIFDGTTWKQISCGYYPANAYALESTISASSTHLQFPTSKAVYDFVSTQTGSSGSSNFLGTSTTEITNGGTETPTIDGGIVGPSTGNIVLYNNLEFIFDGSVWQQFGDENSYVPKTTTINNKPLTSNITLNATDIHAVPTTRTINNKALTSDITLYGSNILLAEGEHSINEEFGYYVEKTRTINSKPLNSNITLYGTDIAISSSNNTTIANKIANLSASDVGALAATAKTTSISSSSTNDQIPSALAVFNYIDGLSINAASVNNLTFQVSQSVPTVNDNSIITFVY